MPPVRDVPPHPQEDIDPRMSARRTEVAREQGRRRLRLVGIGVVVLVVLFGFWSLLHSSLFSVRSVTVVGATHETRAQIEAAAGLAHHPPLFDVNTGAAARGIERLPWVRTAWVTVHWPDGVKVVVSPQTPKLVMVAAGGKWAELSAAGRVLADVTARPPGLIELAGPQVPGDPGSRLGARDRLGFRIATTLPPSFRAQVALVTVESGGESGDWVQLAMTTPILFNIGDASQLKAKYKDVSAMLAGASLHDGDVIDVSIPGAVTVTGG
jgi:hypothetical protein